MCQHSDVLRDNHETPQRQHAGWQPSFLHRCAQQAAAGSYRINATSCGRRIAVVAQHHAVSSHTQLPNLHRHASQAGSPELTNDNLGLQPPGAFVTASPAPPSGWCPSPGRVAACGWCQGQPPWPPSGDGCAPLWTLDAQQDLQPQGEAQGRRHQQLAPTSPRMTGWQGGWRWQRPIRGGRLSGREPDQSSAHRQLRFGRRLGWFLSCRSRW